MRSDNMLMVHANYRYKAKNTDFEGELISAENTYNAPIEVEVLGKTEQVVTVQGKNLFDKSIEPTFFNEYAVFTELDNGFKVSKSAIGQWSCVRIPVIEDVSAFAGQALILSFDAVVVNGTLSAFNVYLMIDTNDTTDRITLKSMTSSINNISSNYKLQFTLPSDLGNTKMLVFQPYADTSQNTEDGYTEYTNVQLELGSTATTYEPFVPDSPSPDYPSDINCVKSGTGVGVVGRNLLNTTYDFLNETTINGVTIKKVSDGRYRITGRSTLSELFVVDGIDRIQGYTGILYQNKNYFFNSYLGDWGRVALQLRTPPSTFFLNVVNGFSIGSDETYVYKAFLVINPNVDIDVTINLQLELGLTATAYQPYQSGGSLILDRDLNAIKVDATSDLCNYIDGNGQGWCSDEYISDGVTVKHIQRIGRKIIDGTEYYENWYSSGTFIGVTLDGILYNNSSGSDIRGICSHFVVVVNGTTHVAGYLGFRQIGDALHRFYFYKLDGIESMADYIDWFIELYNSGNPVTIDYILATPVETDITSTELGQAILSMHSLTRHTNIYSVPASGGLMPQIKTTMKTY